MKARIQGDFFMNCDFSYDHYRDCLNNALERSYIFYKFCEYENRGKKNIFMRHDVDHNLKLAIKMAEVEESLGIKSTYFIRTHAVGYNIFSIESTKILKDIVSMGHEIGFHYENSYSRVTKKDTEKCFKISLAALENCADVKVVSASPHEPSRSKSNKISQNIIKRAGIKYQAYDDIFVKKMKYISDSSCNWREGCMHNFINSEKYDELCILTHPFWWYNQSPLENY